MERPNPETYMTEQTREQWRADLAQFHRELDQARRRTVKKPNPETFMTEEGRERWRADLAAHYRELDRVRNNPARTRHRPGASIEEGIPLAVGNVKLP